MSPVDYSYLLFKKLREGLSPDEASQLQKWLDESPENQKAAAEAETIFKAASPVAPPVDTQAELARLKSRIREEASRPDLRVTYRRSPALRLVWAAAATVALLIGAFYFFNTANHASDLAEITTTDGQVKRISLPDGSVVTLREGGSLHFPQSFERQPERRVQLTGEAYFEVQKDPQHPFIVDAGGCETRVLGTEFNVRAYSNAPISKVSVHEGRVQVSAPNATSVVLNPGDQVVFDKKSTSLDVSRVVANTVADWRNSDMTFQKTPLLNVTERLSDRFNQPIAFENQTFAAGCNYSAYFPEARLEDILKNIESVFNCQAQKLPGGGYLLQGGKCPSAE